jgi:hypothetical protein
MIAIIDCVIAIGGFSFFWIVESAKDLHLVGTELQYPGLVLVATSMILALTTFFGLLAASEASGRGWGLNKGGMRGAIAATMLVVYFFILSVNAFQPFQWKMSEMMQTMMTSFTTILGIMIPFYFGASAYVQTHTKAIDTVEDPKVPKDQ